MSLQIPRTNALYCADDTTGCGVQSSINTNLPDGAGIHVLTVDGNAGSNAGAYTLTYTRP